MRNKELEEIFMQYGKIESSSLKYDDSGRSLCYG